jgi:hypothetical protein
MCAHVLRGAPDPARCQQTHTPTMQTRRELWQFCGAVFDGGRVPVSSSSGTTIVDLTQPPGDGGGACTSFRIVRAGVAADAVVALLTGSFALRQRQG